MIQYESNLEILLLSGDAWVISWFEMLKNRRVFYAGQGFDSMIEAIRKAKAVIEP